MSAIYQPPSANAMPASQPGSGLKVATIIFGVFGFIVWGFSVGAMIGWEYSSGDYCQYGGGAVKIQYGWYISVPTNAAMVYVTARIIFIITSRSFPSPALLADLHESVARMVCFTVLGLTMWGASLSWLVNESCDKNLVYHLCNYGFLFSSLVAGLAGGLWTVASARVMQVPMGAPKYPAPQPLPQTHYNRAYDHHYR